MTNSIIRQCDVLVIGSGGAGLMAAIYAARQGGHVILLEKGAYGRSGCTILGGYSCNAAFGNVDVNDNPRVHAEDTLRAGQYINAPDLVEIFVQEAPQRVLELAEFGVPFDRKDGRLDQGLMPGNSYPRACYSDFQTGRMMMAGMRREVRKYSNITIYEGEIVTHLLQDGNQVVGARSVRWSDSQPCTFLAGAVVLATGGSAQLYERSTVSIDNTGDGMVLALEAGATLKDLEFVQFLPFVMCYPHLLGLNPGTPEGFRFVDVRLTNNKGEEFAEQAFPKWRNKATRDVLAQMLYQEIRAGRASPNGGLYLSVAHNPEQEIRENLSAFFLPLLKQGVDLRKDSVEVAPAAHYHMGGIQIDTNGWTGVPGLFAAGEVTAGVHGANRLAGNALSEILVFGARAGKAAAEYSNIVHAAKAQSQQGYKKLPEWRVDPQGLRPATFKTRLQHLMWNHCGIIRHQEGLEQAMQALAQLRYEAETILAISSPITVYNREILDLLEAKSMIILAQVIVASAMVRKESRGAHYRSDFPDMNDEGYKANVLVVRQGDGWEIELSPIRMQSQQRKNDNE